MGFEKDRLPDPVSYYEAQGLTLQRGGKWRTTRCEFHGGSDSMRINRETGAFVCMAGCGARGGDVLAYQMAAHGQDFVSAAKALGAWVDDPKDKSRPRRRPLPFPARDALEVLASEANLLAIVAANVTQGVGFYEEDVQRIVQAASRIKTIQEMCA